MPPSAPIARSGDPLRSDRRVIQLKGIEQCKYGSTDLKMMPIALSVRKGQPMAAVLGRADGIGIIFVLSSFRMVSIHDIVLRFDLNF